MDLLLQAARVLELETAANPGSDPGTTATARAAGGCGGGGAAGSYITHIKPRHGGDRLDGSLVYSDSGICVGDDDTPLLERTSRRAGGIGTREVHNQLEKNRRKQLREFFNHLQQCIPSLENKRVATQSILQGAIKHIKNLKKKDVEQEREIQTLAKRKSELKKKYDLEFNKCTEEQQRVAQMLLSVIRSKIDITPMEPDGHSSDSTNTASEGPDNEDFSDTEMDRVQLSLTFPPSPGSSDGRKRKFTPRSEAGQGVKASESSIGNPRAGVYSRSLASSSVSSSSVALKHMLEQRKRNQVAAGQANTAQQLSGATSSSPSKGQITLTNSSTSGMVCASASKGPGSLTYSYPVITTHLASTVKPATTASSFDAGQNGQTVSPSSLVLQSSSHLLQPPPLSQLSSHLSQALPFSQSLLVSQSSLATDDRVLVSHSLPGTCAILSSQSEGSETKIATPATVTACPKKARKATQARNKDEALNMHQAAAAHQSSMSSQNVSFIPSGQLSSSPMHLLSDSPLKVPRGAFLQPVPLVSPRTVVIKTPDIRKMDVSTESVLKGVAAQARVDMPNFSGADKTVIEGNASSLMLKSAGSAIRPLNVNTTPSKILPAVLPLSLASIMRGLPVNAGLPQFVTLASTPLAFPSVSTDSNPKPSHTDLASSSLVNSKFHLAPSTNYLLTALPGTTQQSALSLSTNNTRIATLLSTPSAPMNKSSAGSSISNIKPNSPINSSSATTICSNSPIPIPVTVAPTLVTLSLNSNPAAANPLPILSSATPLHILTSLSQTPLMAASLTSDQSLISTVVQLETSGQVALLQNLIPGPHIQNSHHILTQPFVVMATANSNFNSPAKPTTTGS